MKTQLFHSLIYADALAAAEWLRSVGFTEVVLVRGDEHRPVAHAQFRWRDNGGIMFGSVEDGNPHATRERLGQGACYCVVESDAEIDDVYARALAAGGSGVSEPVDQDYGGRSATVADAEGNQFNFGSYAGE